MRRIKIVPVMFAVVTLVINSGCSAPKRDTRPNAEAPSIIAYKRSKVNAWVVTLRDRFGVLAIDQGCLGMDMGVEDEFMYIALPEGEFKWNGATQTLVTNGQTFQLGQLVGGLGNVIDLRDADLTRQSRDLEIPGTCTHDYVFIPNGLRFAD